MPTDEQGIRKNLHRYQTIPRVLCFVLDGEHVLLLHGAPTKPIWPNKYNGLGGHVERGEDVLAAARREIKEESGLDVMNVRLRGVINVDADEVVGIMLFVFLADATSTTVRASKEGWPEWIPLADLSQYDIVEDIAEILPAALAADREHTVFFAHSHYGADGTWTLTWSHHPGRQGDRQEDRQGDKERRFQSEIVPGR